MPNHHSQSTNQWHLAGGRCLQDSHISHSKQHATTHLHLKRIFYNDNTDIVVSLIFMTPVVPSPSQILTTVILFSFFVASQPSNICQLSWHNCVVTSCSTNATKTYRKIQLNWQNFHFIYKNCYQFSTRQSSNPNWITVTDESQDIILSQRLKVYVKSSNAGKTSEQSKVHHYISIKKESWSQRSSKKHKSELKYTVKEYCTVPH